MPADLRKLARNPLAIVGLAALGGWLVGSGVFAIPFALPHFGASSSPAAPAPAPGTLPASSSNAAAIAQTSATMPTPTAAADPFSGWDI